MLHSVRSWVNRLSGLGLLLLPVLGHAQCPVAAGCTPGPAPSSSLAALFNMGIYKVTLGTLSNATQGYTDGYKDYSCTLGTTLPVGAPADITITNGASAPENVRVWIDYNNNGTFDENELAFSSDGKLRHSGSITPPATATLGTKLRMRVASDYTYSAPPTACSTPQYSQDEDYAVTLVANMAPPVAAFEASTTTTCSGSVQFTDQSTNTPSAWSWNFGDGSSSTLQNPSHTYAAAGTYQVQLTASNAAGASTSAATAVTYNPSLPVAAACPGLGATATCCGFGITRVRLGTIDNSSADGSAGYQDFTCPQRTALAAGLSYSLNVTTGSLAGATTLYDTRVWLDLNNDGVFAATEKIGEALSTASPRLTFTVPATAVHNQPLRLRLVADGVGTSPSACGAPTLGQVEDYTVTVVTNTSAPVAAFTSNYVVGTCTTPANTYTFTDASTNGPTAWLWSFSPSAGITFVNGTSANSQNPQVAFATAGTYSVTLQATNANGTSTATASNYLQVQVPCLGYCASNGGYSGSASSFWITSVSVSAAPGGTAFSNASGNAAGGYTLVSAPTVAVRGGAQQVITVATSQPYSHRLSIWIDYNHDGVFANTTGASGELVANSIVTNTALSAVTVAIPASIAATRMRVVASLSLDAANPCTVNRGDAEVEDYLLSVLPLAAYEAQALAPLTVSPNPSADGYLHVQVSEASASGTYDLAVENVLGARLLAGQVRLSPAAAATLDLSALPAGLYLVRFTNAQGQTALRRVVRE